MSSNNQLTKGDASAATSDSNSKMSVGKATGTLALATLLKSQKEITEKGYLSPETHAEVLKFHFLCLKSSKALYSSAFDIDFNSSGRSTDSSSKEMSAVAYGLDNYAQHIKIFLASHGLNHLPPSYLAILDSLEASAQKAESSSLSLPKSITTSSTKRKRNSQDVADRAPKRTKDGDEDKTIPMHGSDHLEDDEDDETCARTNVSTLTDSFKKQIDRTPELKLCVCGDKFSASRLMQHLGGSGLTLSGSGKGRHKIAAHARGLMELSYAKGVEAFTVVERTCLKSTQDLFTKMLTDDKGKQLLSQKTVDLFDGDVEEEGPMMLNFVRTFVPGHWADYLSILPSDSAAAKYLVNFLPTCTLDTKPAAAVEELMSLKPAPLKSTTSPPSATLGSKQAATGATAPNAIDGTANIFSTPRRSVPTSTGTSSTPGVGDTPIASGDATAKPMDFNEIETTSPPPPAEGCGLLTQATADAASDGGNTKVTSAPPPTEGGGLLKPTADATNNGGNTKVTSPSPPAEGGGLLIQSTADATSNGDNTKATSPSPSTKDGSLLTQPAADASSNGDDLLTHEQKMQYHTELQMLYKSKKLATEDQNDRFAAKINEEIEAIMAKLYSDF